MVPNILPCTGHAPTTKNYPTQNVNSDEIEKLMLKELKLLPLLKSNIVTFRYQILLHLISLGFSRGKLFKKGKQIK